MGNKCHKGKIHCVENEYIKCGICYTENINLYQLCKTCIYKYCLSCIQKIIELHKKNFKCIICKVLIKSSNKIFTNKNIFDIYSNILKREKLLENIHPDVYQRWLLRPGMRMCH